MKYTEEIVKAFEKAISEGLPNIQACDLLHISEPTFYRWKEEKKDFCKRIKEAKAKRTKKLLGNIETAGEKQWQASAWILERTDFDNFGNKSKLEVKADVKSTVVSDADLEKIIAGE